jgi:hypothetical protein
MVATSTSASMFELSMHGLSTNGPATPARHMLCPGRAIMLSHFFWGLYMDDSQIIAALAVILWQQAKEMPAIKDRINAHGLESAHEGHVVLVSDHYKRFKAIAAERIK